MVSPTSPGLSLATIGDLPVEVVKNYGVGLGHDLIHLSMIQLDYTVEEDLPVEVAQHHGGGHGHDLTHLSWPQLNDC